MEISQRFLEEVGLKEDEDVSDGSTYVNVKTICQILFSVSMSSIDFCLIKYHFPIAPSIHFLLVFRFKLWFQSYSRISIIFANSCS